MLSASWHVVLESRELIAAQDQVAIKGWRSVEPGKEAQELCAWKMLPADKSKATTRASILILSRVEQVVIRHHYPP